MSAPSWQRLISAEGRGTPQSFRVFYRSGHPLLIIPACPNISFHTAFSLYAPQTALARITRFLWKRFSRVMWCPAVRTESAAIDYSSRFVRFLCTLSGEPGVPAFSILAGNPMGLAPRLIFLVFDRNRSPVAVVKAGTGSEAAHLITRESEFITRANSTSFSDERKLAMPQIISNFSEGGVRAFAMSFVDGESPRPRDSANVGRILSSWLHTGKKQSLPGLAAWQRLTQLSTAGKSFSRLKEKLSGLQVSPALFHGDFVPWNIKVSPKDDTWTVLDWERGELEGPPAWDWFHYVLQTGILAQKKTGEDLASVMEGLLASAEFKRYSLEAGIQGHERDWLRAYLLYCRDVLSPKEGSPSIDFLIGALGA